MKMRRPVQRLPGDIGLIQLLANEVGSCPGGDVTAVVPLGLFVLDEPLVRSRHVMSKIDALLPDDEQAARNRAEGKDEKDEFGEHGKRVLECRSASVAASARPRHAGAGNIAGPINPPMREGGSSCRRALHQGRR